MAADLCTNTAWMSSQPAGELTLTLLTHNCRLTIYFFWLAVAPDATTTHFTSIQNCYSYVVICFYPIMTLLLCLSFIQSNPFGGRCCTGKRWGEHDEIQHETEMWMDWTTAFINEFRRDCGLRRRNRSIAGCGAWKIGKVVEIFGDLAEHDVNDIHVQDLMVELCGFCYWEIVGTMTSVFIIFLKWQKLKF